LFFVVSGDTGQDEILGFFAHFDDANGYLEGVKGEYYSLHIDEGVIFHRETVYSWYGQRG